VRTLLRELNPEQRRAVETTEGPLLVLAGAGTGKTRVVTTRIAYLLSKGRDPESILAVTFTNKAAQEMRERVASLVGKKRADALTIGTFHAFCARTLREHGKRIGIPPRFAIADAADQLAAVKATLRDLHIPESTMHPRALQVEISMCKSRLEIPDDDDLVSHAYKRYCENLTRHKTLDFDDLLLKMLELLRSGTRFHHRFHYLMVDEFQDTNRPQYEIIRALAKKRRNLCVVGDDDQSIYGWRGADVRQILDFERHFPGAAVVRLETNYRSTNQILDAANAVIGHNPARHEKRLHSAYGSGDEVRVVRVPDEESEARGAVHDIRRLVYERKLKYGDCAILFRTANQPRAFEAELRKHNVPYVLVGGMSFFDRKEVRDILAYLKLLNNPDDEVSLLRVINCPPRGIGKSSIDKVLAHAAERGVGFADAFHTADVREAAKLAFANLQETLQRVGRRKELVKCISDLLVGVQYRAEVDRCYPDRRTQDQRWLGVQEVLNFAENYARRAKKPSLAEFLEQLALANRDDEPEQPGKRDAVTLMTLHSAKGLEFPRVYLVGVEEGLLPHERSVQDDGVEEERRLMYVGITRARRHLTISYTKERARYGRRNASMPSRFLFELSGEPPPEDWKPVQPRA